MKRIDKNLRNTHALNSLTYSIPSLSLSNNNHKNINNDNIKKTNIKNKGSSSKFQLRLSSVEQADWPRNLIYLSLFHSIIYASSFSSLFSYILYKSISNCRRVTTTTIHRKVEKENKEKNN